MHSAAAAHEIAKAVSKKKVPQLQLVPSWARTKQ
jgi:hypothetical protein